MSVGAGSIKRAARTANTGKNTEAAEGTAKAGKNADVVVITEVAEEVARTEADAGKAKAEKKEKAAGKAKAEKAKAAGRKAKAEKTETVSKKAKAAREGAAALNAKTEKRETNENGYEAYGIGQQLPTYLL